MKIYTYNRDGFLTGERQARANPKETGKHLLPAMATAVKPPKAKKNELPKFDPEAGTWEIVPNHTGQEMYHTDTGRMDLVPEPGPLPDRWTLEKPPSRHHAWNGETGHWEMSREDLLAKVVAAFNRETEALISAAEVEYTNGNGTIRQGCKPHDQTNWTVLYIKADTLPYPYEVWEGAATLLLENSGEIRAVAELIMAQVETIRRQRKALRDAIYTETAEQLLERLTGEPVE